MMTTIQDYILDYHHGMGMFYLDFVLLAESHVFFGMLLLRVYCKLCYNVIFHKCAAIFPSIKNKIAEH